MAQLEDTESGAFAQMVRNGGFAGSELDEHGVARLDNVRHGEPHKECRLLVVVEPSPTHGVRRIPAALVLVAERMLKQQRQVAEVFRALMRSIKVRSCFEHHKRTERSDFERDVCTFVTGDEQPEEFGANPRGKWPDRSAGG